jgi:SAM-dependent methyltransferase
VSEAAAKSGQVTTSSADYAGVYYATHLGGTEEYSWDSESWRAFFTKVADRIIAVTPARRVLDVGCAKGLLVQAMAAQGVDAYGIDVSEHAITTAHEDIRPRLRVASATDPIEGRYDLITCIEVLEHMGPQDAQDAIDVMCAATDRILFSSSPTDLAEPTHVNVHDNRQWGGWFADRGFYRRTDVDLGFLTPWAVLFERADLSARQVVARYEDVLNPLVTEILAKREALLASQREVQALRLQIDGDPEVGTVGREELARWKEEVALWEAEVLRSRHQMLVNRDHVIGVEAELGRANRDILRGRKELLSANRRVAMLVDRRDSLRKKVAKAERQAKAARRAQLRQLQRVKQLETELASARRSWLRRAAGRARRSLR